MKEEIDATLSKRPQRVETQEDVNNLLLEAKIQDEFLEQIEQTIQSHQMSPHYQTVLKHCRGRMIYLAMQRMNFPASDTITHAKLEGQYAECKHQLRMLAELEQEAKRKKTFIQTIYQRVAAWQQKLAKKNQIGEVNA